ncbi:MAG: transglutaminase-like cysteine peptidase [Sphingomonadaceae bacterium]|nr:transglutaminase-like cysteine peptidase [Sphingomonadaceae bacterium]
MPAAAHAAGAFSQIPQALIRAATYAQPACGVAVAPASGLVRSAISVSASSKASAILGGRPSALERMRLQQAGNLATAQTAPTTTRLSPNSIRSAAIPAFCQNLAPSRASFAPSLGRMRESTQTSDDFLASKRIRIRRTSFDAQWRRVRSQRLSRSTVASLAAAVPGRVNTATLHAVNAWANARIRYVEDIELYGKSDYWASARTTLRRRAGDCEDIAIAKMQILAALGVSRSHMYLTVARDLVRNTDHAVLIVKHGRKHWMLDNSTNQLLDAKDSHDYRPIMSFSKSGKWLHGYSRL